MSVRTRFAPSPTGFLHIGGARTALYCWLEARHHGGQFVLRVEDTDRERSTDEAVQAILDGMRWLGLDADDGPIYQTERLDRYREVAEQLLAAGKAYYAYETPGRDRRDARRGAWPRARSRATTGTTATATSRTATIPIASSASGTRRRARWSSRTRSRAASSGPTASWTTSCCSVPTVFPTYNFAVVVDDIDMGITEVIRGDDHVNNTPRQINVYEALGAPVPTFAHLPMILGADGQKLSKRHGAVGVMQYREDGYLPHALLNYLVRLGWSHGDQEIFSIDEMVQLFDIADVNASAARFDMAKLGWLNQQYLKSEDPAETGKELDWHLRRIGIDPASGPAPADVVVALCDRVQTLREMAERAGIWYGPIAEWDDKAVNKHLKSQTAPAVLEAALDGLKALEAWGPEPIHGVIEQVAARLELGMGKVAQPLRVAITGTQVSPSIDHTIFLAGRDEALRRIAHALDISRGS